MPRVVEALDAALEEFTPDNYRLIGAARAGQAVTDITEAAEGVSVQRAKLPLGEPGQVPGQGDAVVELPLSQRQRQPERADVIDNFGSRRTELIQQIFRFAEQLVRRAVGGGVLAAPPRPGQRAPGVDPQLVVRAELEIGQLYGPLGRGVALGPAGLDPVHGRVVPEIPDQLPGRLGSAALCPGNGLAVVLDALDPPVLRT